MSEDLSPYFYEFGESAVYTNADSEQSSITVIYNKELVESMIGDSTFTNQEHTALIQSSDVSDIQKNNRLNVRSINFYIVDYHQLDNDSLYLVTLSKQSL